MLKILFIYLTFISFGQAQENKFINFGKNYSKILKAPCKASKIPTPDKIKQYIDNVINSNEKNIFQTKTINGVLFQDENALLLLIFEHFTTYMNWNGSSALIDQQVNIQEKYQINPECQKVVCALNKIWGTETSLKMIYIYLKYGFNTSELAFSSSSRFLQQELDDVILALEDLPEIPLPLGDKNQRLTLYDRSFDRSSHIRANATVILYPGWTILPSPTRQYILFHELAHNISSKLDNMATSEEWLSISNWEKLGNVWDHDNKNACFSSSYSKENPEEDFAESVSAFKYVGSEFKKKCSKKYQFIKKHVFFGAEFDSQSNCASEHSNIIEKLFSQTQNDLIDSIDKWISNPQTLNDICFFEMTNQPDDQAIKSCMQRLVTYFLNNQTKVDLKINQYVSYFIEKIESGEGYDKIKKTIFNNMSNYLVSIANSKMPQDYFNNIGFEFRCTAELWSFDYLKIKTCFIENFIELSLTFENISFEEFNLNQKNQLNIKAIRKDLIKNFLEKSTIYDEKIKSLILKIKNGLIDHIKSKNNELKKISKAEWKQLGPVEFCSKFYLNPSIFIKYLLPKEINEISPLKEICTKAQENKNKRFIFSDDDIESIIREIIPTGLQ